MCFNLFYPFIHNFQTQQMALTQVFGQPQELIESHAFEIIIDTCEGTKFDFFVQLQSKIRIFFEVKLSENEFGHANNDRSHREKLRSIYIPRLTGNISAELLEPQRFFRYYQLLRNISYINPGNQDVLFFIFPERNQKITKEISDILKLVSPLLHPRIHIVFLEQLIKQILQTKFCSDLRNLKHYLLFNEKYNGQILE